MLTNWNLNTNLKRKKRKRKKRSLNSIHDSLQAAGLPDFVVVLFFPTFLDLPNIGLWKSTMEERIICFFDK